MKKLLGLLLALCALSVNADVTTITFDENLPTEPSCGYLSTNAYASIGVTGIPDNFRCPGTSFGWNNDTTEVISSRTGIISFSFNQLIAGDILYALEADTFTSGVPFGAARIFDMDGNIVSSQTIAFSGVGGWVHLENASGISRVDFMAQATGATSVAMDNLKMYTSHIASPVPEPEQYAMFLGGLALLGWKFKRTKQVK